MRLAVAVLTACLSPATLRDTVMDEPEKESPPPLHRSASEQTAASPEVAQSLTKVSGVGGIVQTPKTRAMLELEDTGIRGGGMVLLRVLVLGLEEDLKKAQATSDAAKTDADSWREKYYSMKEKSAVLQTQIDALTRVKILQNVCLSIGGIFAGLGFKFLFDEKVGVGVLCLSVGVIFLFTGWLWPSGFSKKGKEDESK